MHDGPGHQPVRPGPGRTQPGAEHAALLPRGVRGAAYRVRRAGGGRRLREMRSMATHATSDQRASPFMTWLLRSPLHGLLSSQVMLITVTGSVTGTRYTFPVNYVRDSGDLVVSSRVDRRWWRNLRGGAPVE